MRLYKRILSITREGNCRLFDVEYKYVNDDTGEIIETNRVIEQEFDYNVGSEKPKNIINCKDKPIQEVLDLCQEFPDIINIMINISSYYERHEANWLRCGYISDRQCIHKKINAEFLELQASIDNINNSEQILKLISTLDPKNYNCLTNQVCVSTAFGTMSINFRFNYRNEKLNTDIISISTPSNITRQQEKLYEENKILLDKYKLIEYFNFHVRKQNNWYESVTSLPNGGVRLVGSEYASCWGIDRAATSTPTKYPVRINNETKYLYIH